jgi:hypothetical protein
MAHCSICQCPAGSGKSELRPYGANGAYVCAGCALAPERIAETERNFLKALNNAGPVVMLDNGGPRPATRTERRKIRRNRRRAQA